MIGFASFTAIGGILFVWQRLPGLRYSARAADWSFWLLMTGMMVMGFDLTAAGKTIPGRRVGDILPGATRTDCRAMCVGPDGTVWAAVSDHSKPGNPVLFMNACDSSAADPFLGNELERLFAYRGEFYGGDVKYQGATLFGGQPVDSTTSYTGLLNELQGLYRSSSGSAMLVTGLGLDYWNRQLTSEQQQVFKDLVAGRGKLLTPYKIWIHAPKLAAALETLGTYLNKKSSLSEREVDRQHAVRAGQVEFGPAQHQVQLAGGDQRRLDLAEDLAGGAGRPGERQRLAALEDRPGAHQLGPGPGRGEGQRPRLEAAPAQERGDPGREADGEPEQRREAQHSRRGQPAVGLRVDEEGDRDPVEAADEVGEAEQPAEQEGAARPRLPVQQVNENREAEQADGKP